MMEYGDWRRDKDDPVRVADAVLGYFRLAPGHDPRREKAEVDVILKDLDKVLEYAEYPAIIAGFGETLVDDKERAAAEALAVLLKGEKQ